MPGAKPAHNATVDSRAPGPALPPLTRYLQRLIGLPMLPLLALCIALAVLNVQRLHAADDRAALLLASHVARAADEVLQSRVQALQLLADSPLLDAPDLPSFHERARSFRTRYGSDVLLADATGRTLLHGGLAVGHALPRTARPRGRSAESLALVTRQPAVGDVFIEPASRRPMVGVAVPVLRIDQAGRVLLTDIDTQRFLPLLGSVDVPAGWRVTLLDAQGRVVAGPPAVGPGAAAGSAAAPSSANAVPVALSTDAAGQDDPGQLFGARFTAPARMAPWTSVVQLSPSARMGPVVASALMLLAAFAAAAMGGVLAGRHGHRRLSRVVASLAGPGPPESDALALPSAAAGTDGGRPLLRAEGTRFGPPATPPVHEDATLHALFSGLPDAVVQTDADGTITMVNPAFTRLFGHAAHEVLGRTPEFLYADVADFQPGPHVRQRPDGSIGAISPDSWEMRYRRRDGSQFWAESMVMPVAAPDGSSLGRLTLHRDATQRRQAQDALTGQQQTLSQAREAHQRFAALFDTAPVAMVVVRLQDTLVVEVNAAFEALVGLKRDAVVGRLGRELSLWPDADFRAAANHALQTQGAVAATEALLQRPNGQQVVVSFSACTVEIAGQTHFIAMMVDVTTQREARQVLQRKHEELEALVAQRTVQLEAANATVAERAKAIAGLYDGAPCGYHALTPEGIVSSVNATELAMLGYTREEFVGKHITHFFTAEGKAVYPQRYAQFMRTGVVRDLEYDVVRKDGSVLPVLISAVMVNDAEGRHVASRATMSDNSERKTRERQIAAMQDELARRAEEAEAATRAKSAFLANMSHEIRTPMNAIIGLAHLMARDAHDPLQSSRLAKIDGAAKHLLQVINDVLDLSKIEAGKMGLEQVDFSLDELLERVFEIVGGRAREKGLELVLDTHRTPGALHGDPTRLSQAVINLMSNAVKFTERGWVRLRIELLDHDEDDQLLLRFEVRDTGIGIALADQAHLFGAFEQADSSTSRRHGGTGLGLALTRHIAAMMEGEAGVESAPGEGSRFWFTARLRAGRAAPPRHELEGRRVLLVDDLAEARDAMAERLQVMGLAVDDFGDPQAALQRASDEQAAGRGYDVLVLDSHMGPPDGLQLLQALRQRTGAVTPPAVLMTAVEEEAQYERARTTGFAQVLLKPITPSTLHDTLVGLLVDVQRPWQPLPGALAPGSMETLVRARHRGQRVLLAEDNPINQEVAVELLRAAGLLVETAADGREAVQRALAEPFDLVLMDMQMPEVDGLEATRRIRAAGRARLPIIAMTANAFGEDRQACLDAGMDDHVAKPVDPERLYGTLAAWLPAPPAHARPPAEPTPAASASPALQDRLAGIDGLDVRRALRLVAGQPALLRRVLEAFVNAYAKGLPSLDAAQAHSLRGACATIGAVRLEAALLAFEQAATGGVSAAELRFSAEGLLDELRELVEAIRRELGR